MEKIMSKEIPQELKLELIDPGMTNDLP